MARPQTHRDKGTYRQARGHRNISPRSAEPPVRARPASSTRCGVAHDNALTISDCCGTKTPAATNLRDADGCGESRRRIRVAARRHLRQQRDLTPPSPASTCPIATPAAKRSRTNTPQAFLLNEPLYIKPPALAAVTDELPAADFTAPGACSDFTARAPKDDERLTLTGLSKTQRRRERVRRLAARRQCAAQPRRHHQDDAMMHRL